MKKILKTFFVVLFIVASTVGLSACSCTPNDDNVEELDVNISLSTKQDYLLTNVYNKPAETDFNSIESDNYVPDADYYITVKTDVVDILTSIKIAGITYADDDTVSLNVGNNNYLIRKAWKVEENSLQIASGLLLSSTNSAGKVPVQYGGKSLTLTTLTYPVDIEFDIDIEGENATISGPTNGVYTYTSSNNDAFFKIKVVDSKDDNILTANSVISVQKIKKDIDGNMVGITYYLIKTNLMGGEYFITYYPALNAGEEYVAGNPVNYNMELRILVLGTGADTLTYNFVNSAV